MKIVCTLEEFTSFKWKCDLLRKTELCGLCALKECCERVVDEITATSGVKVIVLPDDNLIPTEILEE